MKKITKKCKNNYLLNKIPIKITTITKYIGIIEICPTTLFTCLIFVLFMFIIKYKISIIPTNINNIGVI